MALTLLLHAPRMINRLVTVVTCSHRFDIALEADLIEEVCRIYGYNNIPSSQPSTELPLRSVTVVERLLTSTIVTVDGASCV